MEIKTVEQLKRAYPNLIKKIEDNVMDQLGIFGDKRTFTEDKLTPEEKRVIKINARLMAGI